MRRRDMAGVLGVLASPVAAAGEQGLPDPELARTDPEQYWARIRRDQFLLPESRVFLNNGSLGVTPKPVLNAVYDYMQKSASLLVPEYEYPRWGYEMLDTHRTEVAAFLGCAKDELAFTHNATEALSTIAAGVDLQPGDEVVMTDQEHVSGKAGWQLRQARMGISVREVAIPLPPDSPEDVADRLIAAIGPRTKVLFFSGITTTTGLVMPVRQICDAARAKGVLTVVDGAHVHGQIPIRISDLGCDFFAGSPHKWMFAPAGCGFLWGRPEHLDRLWPSIVTGGWDGKDKKAARFMFVGTNNRAVFEGLLAGVRFGNAIGWERIWARIHHLAGYARKRAANTEGLRLLTPADGRMFGSLVGFQVEPSLASKVMTECLRRKIWILRGERMRLAAHIHTRPSDIDAFFDVVDSVRRA